MHCLTALMVLAIAMIPAAAADLAGVSFPDSIKIGEQSLVLNGLGLREATLLKVDIYVAALYLETKASDAKEVLESTGLKRVVMHFVRDLEKERITKAWTEGFQNNPTGPLTALDQRIVTLNSWMPDLKKGDELVFTFLETKGVDVAINGRSLGNIPGEDFARALLAVWLGPAPPTPELKKGMLGRSS